MGPKTLIVVLTIAGAAVWGIRGAVGGFTVGFALALLLGVAVRKSQGGFMPRKVRRSLAANLLSSYPEEVREAFPDLDGESLYSALEEAVETVARKATTIALSDRAIWNEDVILKAALDVAGEQDDEAMWRLYHHIHRQLAKDWYGHAFQSDVFRQTSEGGPS